MQAKKILFPTDFSQYSESALSHATALARDTGALLVIIHVKEPPDSFVDTGHVGYPVDVTEADLLNQLNHVKPTDPSIGYSQKLLTGAPAAEIVRCAETEGADMIVMGTHGRRGLTRMLMGSVAEEVVRKANCPVLTINNLPRKQPQRRDLRSMHGLNST